jgi:hypothetical protein
MSTFDFRVYEEIKALKKEIRQERAYANLAKIMGEDQGLDESSREDFSMSVSFEGE